MDIEKLKKNLEGRGFGFKYFETGAEAADYLASQMQDKTVGIGTSPGTGKRSLTRPAPGPRRLRYMYPARTA